MSRWNLGPFLHSCPSSSGPRPVGHSQRKDSGSVWVGQVVPVGSRADGRELVGTILGDVAGAWDLLGQ